MAYVVPALICLIYLKGYYDMFAGKGTGTLIGWMAFAVLLLAVIFWVCFLWEKACNKGGNQKQVTCG